jgi:hypothetical protein
VIRLEWPDGSLTRAKSWREAESIVRGKQWGWYPSRLSFRNDMSRRALVWSGRTIRRADRVGSSERFIRALAACDLFKIKED